MKFVFGGRAGANDGANSIAGSSRSNKLVLGAQTCEKSLASSVTCSSGSNSFELRDGANSKRCADTIDRVGRSKSLILETRVANTQGRANGIADSGGGD